MSILNERIKERRLALGLTLLQVAEKLNVKEATAQRYESGEIKNIKHETVYLLSQILKCEPAYLMGWTDDISGTELSKDQIKDVLKGILEASGYVDDIKNLTHEQAMQLIDLMGAYLKIQNKE